MCRDSRERSASQFRTCGPVFTLTLCFPESPGCMPAPYGWQVAFRKARTSVVLREVVKVRRIVGSTSRKGELAEFNGRGSSVMCCVSRRTDFPDERKRISFQWMITGLRAHTVDVVGHDCLGKGHSTEWRAYIRFRLGRGETHQRYLSQHRSGEGRLLRHELHLGEPAER